MDTLRLPAKQAFGARKSRTHAQKESAAPATLPPDFAYYQFTLSSSTVKVTSSLSPV